MPAKKWFFISKKKLRRFRQLVKEIFLFLLPLLLISSTIFFLRSDFFKVKHLSCEKEGFPCQKEISFFNHLRGESIFLIKTDEIATKIKKEMLDIKAVEIKKRLPSKLNIKIILRQPLAAITRDEKSFFLVDEEGFIFKKVFRLPENLALILIKDPAINFYLGAEIKQEPILQTLAFVVLLEKNFVIFEKVFLGPRGTITLFLPEAITASFSAEKAVVSQVDSLQFILRQSKIEGKLPKFIDFRFDKPVIKY